MKINYDEIAKQIIRKNLSVKEKEVVLISASPKTLEFSEALAYQCSMIGAQPAIQYGSDKLSLRIYKDINKKHLKNWPKLSDVLTKTADVRIIIEDQNPFLESLLPQDKIEIRRKVMKPIRDREDKRIMRKDVKIVLLGFPTEESARAMGISFNKLNNIFWNTFNIDYNEIYRFNEALAKRFRNAKTVRIIGKKTDIEISIKGRPPMNGCGLWEKEKMGYLNLPDGEIYFAPVENGANGEIFFDMPCMWHYGKQVEGVWFKFKNGKVVDYHINKGLAAFEDVMKHASGTKFNIAELGIGTNPNAKPTGGMTIVDEKVRGTIHIAIGDNKTFGGKGDATIHWDFFKSMNPGTLEVDGKLIMENGKFLDL